MLATIVMATLLGQISVAEQLDGTEIGDATQYLAFNSGGAYHAERTENGATTTAKGTWKVSGQKLEVKIASCKGPACADVGKGYTAEVTIVAERAMTVRSSLDRGPFGSGSYYCRFQGCEKRTGVLIQTHGARPNVMKYLVDFLVDKNRTRDVTVVWWGKKVGQPVPSSKISWCLREEERGRKGAEQVAKDLSELAWFGAVEPAAGDRDCLYDVQVLVADDVQVPAKAR